MTFEAKIPAESKIIVGVSFSEKTGWYSLHLHDALYAVSIRPDEGRVVVAEDRGRRRLQHMHFPFKNIFRFEAVEVPIGHNCVAAPVDADQLGECELTPKDKPFTPTMVRLLIKHSTRNDFISIHDLGATPLPILVPLLKNLPKDKYINANVELSSIDDCFLLSRKVIEWVRKVNATIDFARSLEKDDCKLGEDVTKDLSASAQGSESSDYQELQLIYDSLSPYGKLDVQQTLGNSLARIQVSTYAYREISPWIIERQMVKVAGFGEAYHFPQSSVVNPDAISQADLTVENLYDTCRLYHETTNRPITEAIDVISEHISGLKGRYATIRSNEDLTISKENAPQPRKNIDPRLKINKRHRILGGAELRHEGQLLRVFDNEGIEIYYVENLEFLSLLVEYQTEDGQTQYAAAIRAGLHQALKEFLLAHEMGHWFQHVNADFAARYQQVDRFLRSPAQRDLMEKEADNFAMNFLFPQAYLADRMIFQGGLSVDDLLDEFVAGMTPPITDRLRIEMRRYIGEHVERFEKVQKAEEPGFLTLEVESIEEKDLGGLLVLIHKAKETVHWVRLAGDSQILDASENSEELFGLDRDEIIGLFPKDLVVPEEVEPMKLRAEYRRKTKKAIYYFTEVVNKKKNTIRQVIVYSFPILNEGEYVGAMAALRLLDEIETEALPS